MRRLLAMTVALFAGTLVLAQPKPAAKGDATPKVQYTLPLVVPTGAKTRVVLRGKNLDGVKTVTCNLPEAKVMFLAARKASVPNNYPAERLGDSEVDVELELPKNTKPGEAVLTLGESTKYTLSLAAATIPVLMEKEPNDGFTQPQEVSLPVAVQGAIAKERDVDVFRFTAKAGEKLQAEIYAARLGSPLDSVLTLHDAAGRVIESSDDSSDSPDSRIAVTVPRDGVYFLTVVDANDLGGVFFGYRLVVQAVKAIPTGPSPAAGK